MNDPSARIPEPSLPEHHLLRDAGSMPQLTSGLRDRVLRNCQQQVRYGRWADRLRIAVSVTVACLLVCLVWQSRGTGPRARNSQQHAEPIPETAQHHAVPYISPGTESDDSDPDARPLPQGGPSPRRELIPEMRELNQMIEQLQSRQNAICGLLPHL